MHYIGNGENITNPKGNTTCYAMFHNFEGTSLDLSKFDTSNVTDMSFMFFYCNNLKTLYLENFITKNVVNMSGMFFNCESLEYLDVPNFNIQNVECMNRMFMGCKSLKELDISSFYIGNIKILNDIFFNCKNLKTLEVGSDCLQFFLDHRVLLKIWNKVNIIPVNKLDKAIEDLFY